MKHLNNYGNFKEGKLSKLVAGAMVSASTLLPTMAKANQDDSVKIKTTKTEILVQTDDEDMYNPSKFKIFLFDKNGNMIRSAIDASELPIQNIKDGEYQLNIITDDNKKYMFRVKIEN